MASRVRGIWLLRTSARPPEPEGQIVPKSAESALFGTNISRGGSLPAREEAERWSEAEYLGPKTRRTRPRRPFGTISRQSDSEKFSTHPQGGGPGHSVVVPPLAKSTG